MGEKKKSKVGKRSLKQKEYGSLEGNKKSGKEVGESREKKFGRTNKSGKKKMESREK